MSSDDEILDENCDFTNLKATVDEQYDKDPKFKKQMDRMLEEERMIEKAGYSELKAKIPKKTEIGQSPPQPPHVNVAKIIEPIHTLEGNGLLQYFNSVHSANAIEHRVVRLMEVVFDSNIVKIAIAIEKTHDNPNQDCIQNLEKRYV